MSAGAPLDPWYLEHLACPRDHQSLTEQGSALVCPQGHRYPVVHGIPVMLIDGAAETIGIAGASLAAAQSGEPGWHLETLSLSVEEREGIEQLQRSGSRIDPVVAYLVAATNGLMYRHLIGRLERYPIPALPMLPGGGRLLLDVGCSWGRWTLAAAEQGYSAVGIDPSLGAVLAAQRVATALGRSTRYVVGDARYLPFSPDIFAAAFSYSVIQHFSRQDAELAVREMGRVVEPGGTVKVQMPTRYGLRCLYHQARRHFREPSGFEVRYWARPELLRLFSGVGASVRFEVDGYFGIGLQKADAALMTPLLATVLKSSEALKAGSRVVPPLGWLADSVFVEATVRT